MEGQTFSFSSFTTYLSSANLTYVIYDLFSDHSKFIWLKHPKLLFHFQGRERFVSGTVIYADLGLITQSFMYESVFRL